MYPFTDSQQSLLPGLINKTREDVFFGSYLHVVIHLIMSCCCFSCVLRGLLPRIKPELQCVLEHKQREQHKQRELALCPPSDLEVKLHMRQQKIQVVSGYGK